MSDRKIEILETAGDILRTKSFHAFGFREIAERLGIRKASIHHHFPTKDSLALALIDHVAENADCLMAATIAEAETPGGALESILDLSEAVLLNREQAVCPAEAFEVDGGDLSEEVRARLQEIEEKHLRLVSDLMEKARNAGEVSFLGDAYDQAVLMHFALQGARQAARLEGPGRFRTAVRQLKRSLGFPIRDVGGREAPTSHR